MAFLGLLSTNWFELLQSLGIIFTVLVGIQATRRETQARQINNLNAIKQDYIQIWNALYSRPELERVLASTLPLDRPITAGERLFVKLLVIHLDSVHRAIKAGLFVRLDGLIVDIRTFFSAPIPKEVWEELKPLQDVDFVKFVESALISTL